MHEQLDARRILHEPRGGPGFSRAPPRLETRAVESRGIGHGQPPSPTMRSSRNPYDSGVPR